MSKMIHDLPVVAQKLQRERGAEAILIASTKNDCSDFSFSGSAITHVYLALQTLAFACKNEDELLYETDLIPPKLVSAITSLMEEIEQRSLINAFEFFDIDEYKLKENNDE